MATKKSKLKSTSKKSESKPVLKPIGHTIPYCITIKNTSDSAIKNVKMFNNEPRENRDIQYDSSSFSDSEEGYRFLMRNINTYSKKEGIKIQLIYISSSNTDAPFQTLRYMVSDANGWSHTTPCHPVLDPNQNQPNVTILKSDFKLNCCNNIIISEIPANTKVKYLFYPTEM
jgi:hypothetical protein